LDVILVSVQTPAFASLLPLASAPPFGTLLQSCRPNLPQEYKY